MRSLFVADFQSVRRYHPVEADLAGQTVELVAVGVVVAVHVDFVFGYLSGNLFRVRRHVDIGVFNRFCSGKSRSRHCYNGNKRK